ncbi:MAG TPA: hypothetical protein PKA19_06600 [Bacillota bacterium]|nr:hypothetical protein [Bacillota bacterium]
MTQASGERTAQEDGIRANPWIYRDWSFLFSFSAEKPDKKDGRQKILKIFIDKLKMVAYNKEKHKII